MNHYEEYSSSSPTLSGENNKKKCGKKGGDVTEKRINGMRQMRREKEKQKLTGGN
jgi:hypothetical protein